MPRGAAVRAVASSVLRGGRLAEHRALLDDLGMLRQLGVSAI
jgi:hypothetical protein